MNSLMFSHDAWGQLLVQLPGGAASIVVEPVRAFPLTHPAGEISLLDGEGCEVLRLASLEELAADQRAILERELAARDFSPVIERIVKVKSASPPSLWEVETDRGQTVFEVASEDDFRRLPDGTVIIADANGIRFRIPDEKRLDAASRAILRRFL